MTELTPDGLLLDAQDLSTISPDVEDDDRMFQHDGSSSISMVGGGNTSQRGYYVWSNSDSAWRPLFYNADLLDGMQSGEFVHRDGSLPMAGDLDLDDTYGLINVNSISGNTGEVDLNSNNLGINALSAGSSIQINDNDGLLLIDAQEGGTVNVPNTLNESGNRVATRSWTNANADVPNADYADNANNLDGNDASAFLQVSGDQMEGVLDLGGFDLKDSGTIRYDSSAGVFKQGSLEGPASSLSSYPLPSGDLADDYALTSRFPLPNSDLTNSSVTVSAGNQLTGGGSVSLGGSITVDVDDGSGSALNADLLDGNHASAFALDGHNHDASYILESGDTMGGTLTLSDGSTAASQSWVNMNADVPNADYADSAGDADKLDSLDSSQFLRSDVTDTLNAELTVSGETKVNFGGTNYHVRYDSTRDTLVLGSAENGEVMEMDNAGNIAIEGSLTEGATIGS